MTNTIKTLCFAVFASIFVGTAASATVYSHIKGEDSISASQQCIGKRTQRAKSYAYDQWQEFERSVIIARKQNKTINVRDWTQAKDLWDRCKRVRASTGIGISGDARFGVSTGL